MGHAGVVAPFAAVDDALALKVLETLVTAGPREDQARYPGAGHARRRLLVSGCITPAAIAILRELEIRAREQPDFGPDGESNLSGRIQPQERVLGVGVVAGMHWQVIVPRPRPGRPFVELDLPTLQKFHVRQDPVPVTHRLGRGEEHRLQRHGVRAVEPIRAELPHEPQGALNFRRTRFLAGSQKRQCDQAGRPGFGGLVRVGPRAVR